MSTIKERLVTEIRTSGLSINEIAKRVGVSSEMITQYCTTKKMPSIETFALLCKALDTSADYILGFKANFCGFLLKYTNFCFTNLLKVCYNKKRL